MSGILGTIGDGATSIWNAGREWFNPTTVPEGAGYGPQDLALSRAALLSQIGSNLVAGSQAGLSPQQRGQFYSQAGEAPASAARILAAGAQNRTAATQQAENLAQAAERRSNTAQNAEFRNMLSRSAPVNALPIGAAPVSDPAGGVTRQPLPAPGAVAPNGLPANYSQMIMGFENTTGNPAARNSRSSAMGNGQFIDGTWMAFAAANPTLFPQGASREQILASRADPTLSNQAIEWYGQRNAQAFQQVGIEPTAQNLSLGHYFGSGGATRLLQADRNTPIDQIFDARVLAANPNLVGRNAGQVIDSRTPRVATAGARGAPMPSGDGGMPPAPTGAPAPSGVRLVSNTGAAPAGNAPAGNTNVPMMRLGNGEVVPFAIYQAMQSSSRPADVLTQWRVTEASRTPERRAGPLSTGAEIMARYPGLAGRLPANDVFQTDSTGRYQPVAQAPAVSTPVLDSGGREIGARNVGPNGTTFATAPRVGTQVTTPSGTAYTRPDGTPGFLPAQVPVETRQEQARTAQTQQLRITAAEEASAGARTMYNNVRVPLETAVTLLEAGTRTGRIEDAVLPLRQVAANLGLLSPERSQDVSTQELFASLSNSVVPLMRVPGSGATSDFDARMLQGATINLRSTPEGNLMIARISLQQARTNAENAAGRANMISRTGNDDGFVAAPAIMVVNTAAEFAALPAGAIAVMGGELRAAMRPTMDRRNTITRYDPNAPAWPFITRRAAQ